MIESIAFRGILISDCSIEGEARADDCFPAHPNGLQVSKKRWLILYATRGWRLTLQGILRCR
jgi:hypothetical protein